MGAVVGGVLTCLLLALTIAADPLSPLDPSPLHPTPGNEALASRMENPMNPTENSPLDQQYVVGVDFGTLSGRAVVVRVSDGLELGTGVFE